MTWRELIPLTAELFRCDCPGCGEQADTIHFLPWVDRTCEEVLFACPRHDAGGYWIDVEDWLTDRERLAAHLGEKLDPCDREPGGLGLLLRRVEELTHRVVSEEPAA